MGDEKKVKKLGEAALRNMQLMTTEKHVFKVPAKCHKKKRSGKKSNVLDEDVYVEGIAKIIQRDFFPDLAKLRVQNEFLEASDNKDYTRLREITQKYSGQQHRPATEPYNTPATFETPEHSHEKGDATPCDTIRQQRTEPTTDTQPKPKDIIDNHSLDSYLSSHTSEDNASYERVIAQDAAKRLAKFATHLEAEATSAQLALADVQLPSIEQQADQMQRPVEIQTWPFRAKNFIMYVPEGGGDAAAPKPLLQHHNTRFQAAPFDHDKSQETITAIAKQQDASVPGRIGVDGECVQGGGGGGGGEQYPLVATPSPRPGAGPDQSPLMTWGEIEGTPFRLDGGDTPLPAVGAGIAYRMLASGSRERIALKLAEQAARRRRPTTPRIAPPTPSFRSNTERLASMSPAARRLVSKHLMSPRLKLTPSDIRIRTNTGTPKRTNTPNTPLVATLKGKAATPRTKDNVPTDNITDNLLQINVEKRDRLKAVDFFK